MVSIATHFEALSLFFSDEEIGQASLIIDADAPREHKMVTSCYFETTLRQECVGARRHSMATEIREA
jgi:hypothetical protein